MLEQKRTRIACYGKTPVSEQNMKSTLIQSLLQTPGLDGENCDEVLLEYRQKGRETPADDALLLLCSTFFVLRGKVSRSAA